MDSKAQKKLSEFFTRVNHLYSDIELWLKTEQFIIKKEKIEISEKIAGSYKIESLIVLDNENNKIAELRPVGAWIIAAEGRVDIIGKLNKENLVYLISEGPHLTIIEEAKNSKTAKSSRPLFRGIEGNGWYWIESKRPGRARLLDKNLFIDLMSMVSDYEFV